jgi:invasion protein IalB
MKNAFFAALAVLTLSVAAVPAYARDFHNGSTVAGDRAATQMQQYGAVGRE